MSSVSPGTGLWDKQPLPIDGERLTDQLSFGNDQVVSFHWSDFRDACDLWQARIIQEPGLKRDYERRLQEITKLRGLPVWVRSGKTTTQTNLYALYEGFICNGLWQVDESLPRPSFEISLIAPSGPFRRMSINECFNMQTYRDFVMIFLLQNKLPRRDFRLRVKCKLLAEFGADYSGAGVVGLEQITRSGVLLQMSGDMYYGQMRPGEGKVRLLFKTQLLREAGEARSAQEFRSRIESWRANPFYTLEKSQGLTFACHAAQPNSRFDGDATQDCFVMVPFDHMESASPGAVAEIQRFIQVAQKTVLSLLDHGKRAA